MSFVFTYGRVVTEQKRTSMVRQSQLFLRRMVEDIRVSNNILTTNNIPDSYRAGGWVTSDPANILIATIPAVDNDNDLLIDPTTEEILYHEVIYFSDNGNMYRRVLQNPLATGSKEVSTCPVDTSGCIVDITLVEDIVDNMLFEFYDIDDVVTSVPEEARSIQMTINVSDQAYGQELNETNSTRVTLRNE